MARGGNIWLKAEVWPVLITVVAGVGVCAFHCTRTLVKHNDIVFNKSKPLQIEDQDSPKYINRTKALGLADRYFRY